MEKTTLSVRNDKGLELLDAMDRFVWVTRLSVTSCDQITMLPESLGEMACLDDISLFKCEKLKRLPESLGQLQALTVLCIWCCGITQLPESIGRLRALCYLSVQFCKALKSLPETLGLCNQLQVIRFGACRALTMLPESIGQLTALTEMNLLECDVLVRLPVGLGQLDNLDDLQYFGCPTQHWMNEARMWCSDVHAASTDRFSTDTRAGTRAVRVLCQRSHRQPKLLLLIVATRRTDICGLPAELWQRLLDASLSSLNM